MIRGSAPRALNLCWDEATLAPCKMIRMSDACSIFRGRRTIPVLRVQVPGDNLVVVAFEGVENVGVLSTVGRAEPLGLYAENLLKGSLETLHFSLNTRSTLAGQVLVTPSVGRDLVATAVCSMEKVSSHQGAYD